MDILTPEFIDLYCERTAFGFWDEPINALSNIAFLVVSLFAARIALKRSSPDIMELTVIFLAGLIGVGSFLFHTFATPVTELADILTIWTFVAAFVLLIIYRASGEALLKTVRITVVSAVITGVLFWFTAEDLMTDQPNTTGVFNGSMQYAPALFALVLFAALTIIRRHPARYTISAAALAFFVALFFRTIDLEVCNTVAIGTHFLWHILNGLMVGLLLFTLLRHFPPRAH